MTVFFVILALDAVSLHLTSARAGTSNIYIVPHQENAPDGTVTVPAGGFAKLTYEFELSQNISGAVSLTLKNFKSGSVLFAAFPPVEQQDREEENARQGQLVIGEKQNEFQPFLKNPSAYKPVYFLFGVDPGMEKSKFQVSFKYKLFNAPFDSQGMNSLVDGFHHI